MSERLQLRKGEEEPPRRRPEPPAGSHLPSEICNSPSPRSGKPESAAEEALPCPDPVFLSGLTIRNDIFSLNYYAVVLLIVFLNESPSSSLHLFVSTF